MIALLQQQAPTWLVQMPAVVSTTELEELQRRTAGVTRERMLRELVEALEALTAVGATGRSPLLILVLEDLHWSDYSTLDLLSVLARRPEAARLLIVGTYRPVEVLTRDHPLKSVKQELQLHGQCEELAPDFLSEAAVAEYLEARFPSRAREGAEFPPLADARGSAGQGALRQLAHLIHQRTDGNALFMVNVTNELAARKVVTERDGHWEIHGTLAGDTIGVPENLRQLIEQQLARVSLEERQALEAASVVGAEFSAAAVAAGVEQSSEAVETYCDSLARREQFLRARGTSEWPDGTLAARYGFVHALYQEVFYEQISASRRIRLHRRIGECEERGYGDRAREIATELAVHFERGRDYPKAIQYLQQAGENALRRSANQEAIGLLTKGLELLKTLPDTPKRVQQELRLQVALVSPLQAKGFAASELERVCARIRELCQQVEEIRLRLFALAGLGAFYQARAEYQTVYEIGEQLLRLAQNRQDSVIQMRAQLALGTTSLWLGELISARAHLEQVLALHDPLQPAHIQPSILSELKVAMLPYLAFLLEVLGYPDQALQRSHEVLTLAQGPTHPFSLAYVLNWTTYLHHVLRESRMVQERRAEAVMSLSEEHGFTQFFATGLLMRGWALTEQGQAEQGIAQIRQGLATWQAIGAERHRPYFLTLLAAAYGKGGQAEEGLVALAEALDAVNKTGGHVWEAELYRLKGELTLQQWKVESQKSKNKKQKHVFCGRLQWPGSSRRSH